MNVVVKIMQQVKNKSSVIQWFTIINVKIVEINSLLGQKDNSTTSHKNSYGD